MYNFSWTDHDSSLFPPFFFSPSVTLILTSSSFIPTFSLKVSLFSTSAHVGNIVADGWTHPNQCYSHSQGQSSAPSSSGKSRTLIRFLNSHDTSRSLRSIYPRLSISKKRPSRAPAVHTSSFLTSVFAGRTPSWRERSFSPHRSGRTFSLYRWKT